MTLTLTSEETNKLIQAVTTAGLAVAIADMGIISTAIEATAMAKEVVGAGQKYPNNALIQAAFSEEALKQGFGKESTKELTPENALSEAIAIINEAVTLASSKVSPEEVQDYKQLIYDVADRVANAAGSGLFGSGKQKVSPEEQAALTQIKAALGI